jgi:hypothetical protein
MEPQPCTCRVQLQVKGSGFDSFLFLTGESVEAMSEGVGDAEFH